MLNIEYFIIAEECIKGRKYRLLMRKISNTELEFIIKKLYNNVESNISIDLFKNSNFTNKIIKSKKQIMRKKFYNIIGGIINDE